MSRAGTAKWALTNNYATGTDSWSLYDYPSNKHRITVEQSVISFLMSRGRM